MEWFSGMVMFIGVAGCVCLIVYLFMKGVNKETASKQTVYDYIAIIKSKDVSNEMLGKKIQEVFKCRKNGDVYRGKCSLLKEELHALLAEELEMNLEEIEVYDTKPYLSYIHL